MSFENTGLTLGKNQAKSEKTGRPQRIRLAIEELGPTFIKLGQILSTRPDLVSVDIMEELSLLQDQVPAFSSEEALKAIEDAFGKPASVFDYFDGTP